MSKIIKSLLAAGMLLTAIGCNKDQIGETFDSSGENASAAYFSQKSVSEEFVNTATGDQTLLVNVFRQNSAGDITVGIEQLVPDASFGVYSIPEELTFKNGEFKAVLEITVHDVETFAKGASYSAKIGVGDHHQFKDVPLEPEKRDPKAARAAAKTRAVNVTKYTEITISTSLALDWKPAYIPQDMANLVKDKPEGTDDKDWFMLGADEKPMPQTVTWKAGSWDWGMESGTEDLAVQRAAGTNVYRILNAGEGGANFIFTIDTDESHKLTIDGKEFFRCVMTEQALNLDLGYGPVFGSDIASYIGNDAAYADFPCYWDGQNGFFFTLLWYDSSPWNDHTAGITDIFLFKTGNEKPEPKVGITYLGGATSQTGIKTHSLSYEPNSDVAYYNITLVKEDLSKLEDDALKAKLEAIQKAVEEETYADYPVLRNQKAAEDAWNLGTEKAMYTALAFSYASDGKTKSIDFQPFLYNPAGDAAEVKYEFVCGAGGFGEELDFTDYSLGYFGDNSVMIHCGGPAGDITAVKYALVSKADFAAAGLTDDSDDAALIAYVDQNGRSFNDAALKDVNGITQNYSNYIYLAAAAQTEYKLIASISNADATTAELIDVTTQAAAANAFAMELSLDEDLSPIGQGQPGFYKHTHVLASFTGAHVVSGNYLMMSTASKGFAEYFKLDDGKLTLKADVTDEKVLTLIQSQGSALSTGEQVADYATSALFLINAGDQYGKFIEGAPETEYVILACADHDGTGAKSWTWDIIATDFAPAVNFTQELRAEGSNLRFAWKATPTDEIFVIQQVVYALVPKSALSDAGVDMTKISDEQLNDFDARRAAPAADKAAIDAQEQNAAKLLGVLQAQGKTLKADAVKLVNKPGGLAKQFENMAAGDYALIAMAYDSYNTRLTVGQIAIQ